MRHESSAPVPPQPILPFDVRYSLQYRGAQFGREELMALAKGGYEIAAWSFAMKGLNDNPLVQEAHLNAALPYFSSGEPHNSPVFKQLLEDTIHALPPTTAVDGKKMAQLARQGIRVWENNYAQAAQTLRKKTGTPALVSYATFIGIPEFVRAVAERDDGSFLLVHPRWIQESNFPVCGFTVESDGAQIKAELLPKNFKRPKRTTVIDDTARTGTQIGLVTDFLGGKPDVLILDMAA